MPHRPTLLTNCFAQKHVISELEEAPVGPIQGANGAGSNQPTAAHDKKPAAIAGALIAEIEFPLAAWPPARRCQATEP